MNNDSRKIGLQVGIIDFPRSQRFWRGGHGLQSIFLCSSEHLPFTCAGRVSFH
jgi:hypothetical protein